jgi:hypothetical protein
MSESCDENRLDPVIKALETDDGRVLSLRNADIRSLIVYTSPSIISKPRVIISSQTVHVQC